MDVLDLRGPEFLKFYVPLASFCVAGAFALRWYLRQPGGFPKAGDDEVSPDQVAFLAGGPKRMVDAAITGLVHANHLEITGVAPPRLRVQTPLDASAPVLDRAIYAATESTGTNGQTVATIRQRVAPIAEGITAPLLERGLIMSSNALLMARVLPAIAPLLCTVLGIAKGVVGVYRGKPVGFLVVAVFVQIVGVALLVATCPTRSRLGDKVLGALKLRSSALWSTASTNTGSLSTGDMMLAFALFGPDILASGEFSDLHHAMKLPREGGSGCGSSSSCGSSSCGGGSSCGSSCGGGGCGGCGGGD